MAPLSLILLLLALCAGTLSSPVGLTRRAVDANTLGNLSFYGQYAAAAYCPNNNVGPATLKAPKAITCPTSNNCPEVQANKGVAISEFQNFGIGDTTGFVAIDRVAKAIIVSFRGSESLANFITNLEFTFANANSVCLGCQLSTGFFNDWKVANTTVINAVKQATGAAENQGYKLVVTGHSLGAAVATICAAVLRGNYSYTLSLYTYGSPMVGNAAFVTYVTNQPLTQGAGQNYRVTHQNDLVPNLPGYSFDYRHVSPQYWITSPDNITVTTSDINVSSGIEDEMGDYYSLLEIFETSNAAHSWYFNHIDVCFADNNGTILNGR